MGPNNPVNKKNKRPGFRYSEKEAVARVPQLLLQRTPGLISGSQIVVIPVPGESSLLFGLSWVLHACGEHIEIQQTLMDMKIERKEERKEERKRKKS